MTASSFINNIELTTFLASSTLLEDVLPRDRHPPLANELHAHTTSLVYKSTRETKRQQHHQGVRDKTSNTILAVVYNFFSGEALPMYARLLPALPDFHFLIQSSENASKLFSKCRRKRKFVSEIPT